MQRGAGPPTKRFQEPQEITQRTAKACWAVVRQEKKITTSPGNGGATVTPKYTEHHTVSDPWSPTTSETPSPRMALYRSQGT